MGALNASGQEQVDYARYRSAIYMTVASVFAGAPSVEQLQRAIEAARQADAGSCVRACEAELFEWVAGQAGGDLSELRTKIASEYAELFVGPRPPLAPLYESLYLGFPNRLFTEQTMSVRRFYARYGREVIAENRVPDDHLAYELEFMGYLCAGEADCLEAGDCEGARGYRAAQGEFLLLHLGSWCRPFAERADSAWCGEWYAAWARFVCAFVAEDEAFLKRMDEKACGLMAHQA